MRVMLALSTLLLLTAALSPPANAAAEGEPLLTDATGDVAAYAYGPAPAALPTPVPEAASGELDLVSWDVVELDDEFVFTHEVVSLADSTVYGTYVTQFSWNDKTYAAMGGYQGMFGGYSWASLYEVLEGGRREYVVDLEVEADVDASTVTVRLPRFYVLDGEDRPPLKGDELTDLYAYSARSMNYNLMGQGAVAGGLSIADRVPDDAAIALPITLGGEANGHLRVLSLDPIRVSNGGATTFVFQLLVENQGDAEDAVALSTTAVPEGWSVSVQSPVRVPAKESREVPVLASVPFEHKHGGFDAFTVRAESSAIAGAFAQNRLGVLHTPTPQPAGHHPELYLHGSSGSGLSGTGVEYVVGYLNTDADHSADASEVHVNEWREGTGWRLDLEPALSMGLDFDLAGLGTLSGSILGHSTSQAEVWAEVLMVDADGDETVLAESDVQSVTFDLQEPTPFALTLTPTKDADYVPYAPDQNLRVRLIADHMTILCCGSMAGPSLLTEGFVLKLPLNEYHDRLQGGTGDGTGGLQLMADGPVEKAGRPGDLLAYAFTLRNGGDSEETFVLSTAGNDAGLGSLAPSGEVRLGPGETTRVTLGVRVPADAAEGQSFEVLVFARAQSDPSITAIGRTMTSVAFGEAATPDESAVFAAAQDEANETPAPGLALALAGVALAASLRASRRRD